MKTWANLYIPVLLIVLILLIGMTLSQRQYISDTLLNESMQEVSGRARSQADALSRYLSDYFEENGNLSDWRKAKQDTLYPIVEGYVKDRPYHEFGMFFRLYKEEELENGKQLSDDGQQRPEGEMESNHFYDSVFRDDLLQKNLVNLNELRDGETVIIKNIYDGTLLCTTWTLPHCDNYKLLYIEPINARGNWWRSLTNTTLVFGLATTILFLTFMALIIRTLTRPLNEFALASREYSRRNADREQDAIEWNEIMALPTMFKTMAEESRRLEEAEEDTRRKQRFLDSLTHEMRTPLTNIHGYSELMKRVQLSEEDRLRYLDYLMHESRRLNRLSDELFDLIVMRKNTAQMEPVSCAGLLDTVRDSLENKAGGRGVGLVCEQSGARLYGNPALLESLCTNLAENAIRACGEGDEVRMSFQDSGRYVLLRVEDTGMGIPADELKHITEPFYRVDKARSRAEGGVGLGLYLCSEIVRIHGAVMFIDSREGEGTTVTVRFAGEKNN